MLHFVIRFATSSNKALFWYKKPKKDSQLELSHFLVQFYIELYLLKKVVETLLRVENLQWGTELRYSLLHFDTLLYLFAPPPPPSVPLPLL